jgi:hypothetical protein
MKQRYITAFTTATAPDGEGFPFLLLRVSRGCRRFILKVCGDALAPAYHNRVALGIDQDEGRGFINWLRVALSQFPTDGYRSIYTFLSGQVFGIETADGRHFDVMAGQTMDRDWGPEWRVRSPVHGGDLDCLVEAMADCLPLTTGEPPARRL